MEIKENAIYKKRMGEFTVKVVKVTSKMVEYAVNSAVSSFNTYRLNKNNFIKYYEESELTMSDIKILGVDVIDNFGDELVVQTEIEVLDKQREFFGMNIDKDNYMKNCWRVMSSYDSTNKTITSSELFYVDNNGNLNHSDVQLSKEEELKVIDFIKADKSFLLESENNL